MTLPIAGAALTVAELPSHIDWLREHPRDLELQDFCLTDIREGLAFTGRSGASPSRLTTRRCAVS
jgi:hypothetical protein